MTQEQLFRKAQRNNSEMERDMEFMRKELAKDYVENNIDIDSAWEIEDDRNKKLKNKNHILFKNKEMLDRYIELYSKIRLANAEEIVKRLELKHKQVKKLHKEIIELEEELENNK